MAHASSIRLTPQQQAIVAHNLGPAVVYAVAGAGKTTAMVHRIARLVAEEVFPARRILAVSFNVDANRQIEAGLKAWPRCADVRVKTLHAMGFAIVRLAQERGYLARTDADANRGRPAAVERDLLARTVADCHAQGVGYAPALTQLDGDHFLAFVARCKGNLQLPAAHVRHLPRRLRRIVQKPVPPPDLAFYVDLFTRFEMVRLHAGWTGFDDMLVTGWLLLAQHADLLAEMRRRHGCVLADEYQDVNRAQAELLDLLTAPYPGHPWRNLMVIGDDDQTIYEWRGASPQYMRAFVRRYRGTATYFMTDNFRGRAVHLALANQVIEQDGMRQRKYLQLTRGFDGLASLDLHSDATVQADAIARQIGQLHREGVPAHDVAVLLRVYAQAAPLTAALQQAGLPWTLVDDRTARSVMDDPHHRGVAVMSIYRAKGLEWPVVFVPDCNDGVLPLARAQNLDEERRLFYVALTRAREQLRLHALVEKPLSPFLERARYDDVLAAVDAVRAALGRDPAQWTVEDFLAVAVNAKRLYFHEYFAHWWPVGSTRRQRVAEAVLRFYATLRRKRRFRALGLARQDVVLWRQVARTPVAEGPLDRPDIDAALDRLG